MGAWPREVPRTETGPSAVRSFTLQLFVQCCPVTLASPGNLLNLHILGLTPDLPSYKEALGLGPSHQCCSQLSTLKLDVTVLLASWNELFRLPQFLEEFEKDWCSFFYV